MSIITVGIMYGGDSPEHDVSRMTAESILKNIDREKYRAFDIFVDRGGNFDKNQLKKIDIAFLAFHGENYEDGKFQKYLVDKNIKYTGSGVKASQINMDKDLQKSYFKKVGLKTVESFVINNNDPIEKIDQKIGKTISYPIFVKPANTGSSLGISKALHKFDLKRAMTEASKIGSKIIIEKALTGVRELEVGVLGNNNLIISKPGEVLSNNQFYSYEAKYFKPFKTTTTPENLPEKISQKIIRWAEKAYRATDCKGYARVDFFLDKGQTLYINEINTLPGFTKTSMYPSLMEGAGIKYQELIAKIIEFGLAR